jgi:hypothetical protein
VRRRQCPRCGCSEQCERQRHPSLQLGVARCTPCTDPPRAAGDPLHTSTRIVIQLYRYCTLRYPGTSGPQVRLYWIQLYSNSIWKAGEGRCLRGEAALAGSDRRARGHHR